MDILENAILTTTLVLVLTIGITWIYSKMVPEPGIRYGIVNRWTGMYAFHGQTFRTPALAMRKVRRKIPEGIQRETSYLLVPVSVDKDGTKIAMMGIATILPVLGKR